MSGFLRVAHPNLRSTMCEWPFILAILHLMLCVSSCSSAQRTISASALTQLNDQTNLLARARASHSIGDDFAVHEWRSHALCVVRRRMFYHSALISIYDVSNVFECRRPRWWSSAMEPLPLVSPITLHLRCFTGMNSLCLAWQIANGIALLLASEWSVGFVLVVVEHARGEGSSA